MTSECTRTTARFYRLELFEISFCWTLITEMALGTTMRGLVALMVLVTTIASTFAAHGGCRGLDGNDEIAALSLSPGLVSRRVLSEATLTWEFPDDVCLSRWLITLTPLGGGSSKSVSFYEESDARRANLPMNDLQPGVQYRVNIAMEFANDRFGPEKSIDRVPVTLCDAKGVPGVPVELSVKSQTPQGYTIANDYMEVCWSTNSENLAGCPDEYTVAFRVQPSSPSDLFDERYAWRFEKFPVAGCHSLYDIEKGAVYDIGIRAFNAESKSSSEVALIREYAVRLEDTIKSRFDNFRRKIGTNPSRARPSPRPTAGNASRETFTATGAIKSRTSGVTRPKTGSAHP